MIFAVIGVDKPELMGPAINKLYPNDSIIIGENQWLVVDYGTAKDVSDKLGVTNGPTGSAMIISMSGYYGRKSTNIWEWIKAKMAQTNG